MILVIAISEGNWCYLCTVSEKYSSCTTSLKGHIMYFTDNMACRCVGCGTDTSLYREKRDCEYLRVRCLTEHLYLSNKKLREA